MKDLCNRQDIEILVVKFYEKLMVDEIVSTIFTDVAQINLETHLPVISDFWESVLFGTGDYRGNPMIVHLQLHQKKALTDLDFEVWLRHWKTTIDELFRGDIAQIAKERASSIAMLMKYKIEQL